MRLEVRGWRLDVPPPVFGSGGHLSTLCVSPEPWRESSPWRQPLSNPIRSTPTSGLVPAVGGMAKLFAVVAIVLIVGQLPAIRGMRGWGGGNRGSSGAKFKDARLSDAAYNNDASWYSGTRSDHVAEQGTSSASGAAPPRWSGEEAWRADGRPYYSSDAKADPQHDERNWYGTILSWALALRSHVSGSDAL